MDMRALVGRNFARIRREKGLTQEQRNQAMAQIFGSDAVRAASILYKDGAAGVERARGHALAARLFHGV